MNGKVFTFPLMKNKKFDFLKNMLSVSAVMFCKQFIAYTVHIDWCYHSTYKHSFRSQHISVLTTCTFMFRQFYTIEHILIKTTSGMHRRPFEGRLLVFRVLSGGQKQTEN